MRVRIFGRNLRARASRAVKLDLALEAMERRRLLSTYQVISAADDGSTGTLRWAILQVNQDQTPDTIDFAIGGTGIQTIQLSTPLPALTNSAIIDGTTHSVGYSGSPLIDLDGSKLPANTDGLTIDAGASTIRGLAINGFSGSAIVLAVKDGNLVTGNDLGTDATGATARPNGIGISILGSSQNTIGGTSASAGNLISGNAGNGISTSADRPSSRNLIQGNLIGTDSTGRVPLPNGLNGIFLDGSSGDTIGGTSKGAGNVVSGNGGDGMDLAATTGTAILGNFIGSAGGGGFAIGNHGDGIFLFDSPSNTIGGTSLSAMNVISANFGNGINAQGVSNKLLIEGNAIGTDPTGVVNLGNQSNGIDLFTSQDTIGGLAAGAGNMIAFNGTGSVGTGIQLGSSAEQDSFLSNSIYGDHRLGINLGNGPTADDYQDTDAGANGLQNYPILTSSQTDGLSTSVQGTLNSTPNTQFLIQFFSSPSADSSGFGPGKTLLGSLNVTTDNLGNVKFSVPGIYPSQGGVLTATATDSQGNTSEFSHAIGIQSVADLSVSVWAGASSVDVGSSLVYRVTVSNLSADAASGVAISDMLPGSVTIQSISSTAGVASVFGNMLTATLPTLAGGASAIFTITVIPQAGAIGSIVDSAQVSSLSVDPNPSNNSSSVITTVKSVADLGLNIVADGDSVPIEGDASFGVTINNLGPSTAHNVLLQIPLDPSSTFVSLSSTQTPTVGSDGSITVDLGDLASGESINLTLVLRAIAASGLNLNAEVSSDADDLDSANNSASLTEPVTPATDLAVSISAGQIPAFRGASLVYTVVVANIGPSDATGVVLAQLLPVGTTFVSALSDAGAQPTSDGTSLTDLIGDLKVGAKATVTIEVRPLGDSPDSISTTISVSSDTTEIIPANNSATLATPVADESDLSVTTASSPTPAEVGQAVTYTLTVTNHGPSDDTDVQLQDLLPAGLTFESATSTVGAQPVYSSGKLTTALGNLASGQSATIRVNAIPTLSIAGGLIGTATVRGANPDPDETDNTSTYAFDVAPVDLCTTLTANQSQVQTGQMLTYTATVRNNGNSPATGVLLSLPIGPLVQIVSIQSTAGTVQSSGNLVSGSLGILASGATATVTIRVQALQAGSTTASAAVSADEYNTDPASGAASLTSVIQEAPGVLGFASAAEEVPESAGSANITVVRTWGSAGTVTVDYQTVAGSAVPGKDFIPTSGTLVFLPGQTSETIQVPVMASPHSGSDYTLSLNLSTATAGAVLGPQQTSILTIHDPDPDTTPPQVSDISLLGGMKAINSISLSFSEPIGVDTATDFRSFRLVDLGSDGRIGTGDDRLIAIDAPSYNPTLQTVTITPTSPLPAGHYYGIQIVGNGPDAIHDLAGNLLDGTPAAGSGTTYTALFARGTDLTYKDSQGNTVNLRLKGPGLIDQFRDADGDGEDLRLENVVHGKSTLSGTVKRGRAASGSTQLGAIEGLGTFGQIRVKLSSPAFVLRQYPFFTTGRGQSLITTPIAKAAAKHPKAKPLVKAVAKPAKPRPPAKHAAKPHHR